MTDVVIDFAGAQRSGLGFELDNHLHVTTLLVCQNSPAGTSHAMKSVRSTPFFIVNRLTMS